MSEPVRGAVIYGLLAEFDNPTEVVDAARRVHEEGYRKVDAYTPYPIEELGEALGHHHSHLPLLVLIGGITGACAGFMLQFYTATIDYPINVGGRPFNSWPAFIVPTFETTILFAALTAVFGMLALNGLPEPYHPVFNVPSFEMASRNRFFLCIQSTDPKFDLAGTRRFLEDLEPQGVYDVEP